MCVCVCVYCALPPHLYYTNELVYNETEGLVVPKREQHPRKTDN